MRYRLDIDEQKVKNELKKADQQIYSRLVDSKIIHRTTARKLKWREKFQKWGNLTTLYSN